MSEELGYIKGKVEGIEKTVDKMTLTQTEIFLKFDGLEDLIKDLPCPKNTVEIETLKEKVKENNDRSHSAESIAEEIKVKTRPIIEASQAAAAAEITAEDRKWYQRTEIRIYIVGGTALCLIQWLPDLVKKIISLF